MIEREELICIGHIGSPYGVKGAVNVVITKDFELKDDTLPDFVVLEIDGLFVPFRVLNWDEKNGHSLLQLKGLTTPQDCIPYIHTNVFLFKKDIIVSSEDISTIIGYTLFNQQGTKRGTICAIDDSTINILLELADGTLLPYHDTLVVARDDSHHTLTLQIPEGL